MNKRMTPKETSDLFRSPKKSQSKKNIQPEKVRINNLAELKDLIKRIKPQNQSDSISNIVVKTSEIGMTDESYDGPVIIPQSGGQPTIRKTLLEGFEMVKNQIKYYNASLATQNAEEYGEFSPAIVPNPKDHRTWLDTFINNNMGGERDELSIIWELPEGTYKLDPWSCELKKVDDS